MRIITDGIARTIVSDVDHGGGAGRCAPGWTRGLARVPRQFGLQPPRRVV